MHVNALGAFVASRHAEVSLVMRDKRFGKDYVERTIRRYGPKIMEEPVFRSMSTGCCSRIRRTIRGCAASW